VQAKENTTGRTSAEVSINVVDPQLFFSDPDPDPIFLRVLGPNPGPTVLDEQKNFGCSFGSDP
jgi:hypothetical protein